MLSFLKKLGTIIANVAGVAAGIGPIIRPLLGSGSPITAGINDLTAVGQIIAQVEVIGATTGLTGMQKLQAATPLVASVVRTSEMIAGKKIANDGQFIQGIQWIVSGVVAILNSIHPDEVAASGQPMLTPPPSTPASANRPPSPDHT